MGESYMVYPDGRTVPFSSLTDEEKAQWWESAAKRIGQAITDYVKRHPEHYELVRNALLSTGGHIIEKKENEEETDNENRCDRLVCCVHGTLAVGESGGSSGAQRDRATDP